MKEYGLNFDQTLNSHVSRRRLLTGLLGIGTSLAFGGCSNEAPPLKEFLDNRDKLSGYLAASSVILVKKPQQGQETQQSDFIGHGGLYMNNNKLWLVTVKHVSDNIKENETMSAIFPGITDLSYIRDVSSTVDNFSTFSERARAGDRIIAFPLGDYDENATDSLSIGIKEGRITPLSIATEQPQIHQSLGVVGGTSGLVQVTCTNFDKGYGWFKFKEGESVCAGQSGTSMLALDSNGNPTGKGLGTLAVALDTNYDNCSDQYGGYIPFKIG